MKIFAFTDIHADINAIKHIEEVVKKEQPDIVICTGDLSIFEDFIEEVMDRLAKLPKHLYVIHGNHEGEDVLKKICSFHENVTFCHKKVIQVKDFVIVSYGGGGFSKVDKGFEDFVKSSENQWKGKKVILLTHAPPFNTALDNLHGEHYGCKSYTEFVKKNNEVVLHLSGHFHETFNKQDKTNKALLVNSGARGTLIEI